MCSSFSSRLQYSRCNSRVDVPIQMATSRCFLVRTMSKQKRCPLRLLSPSECPLTLWSLDLCFASSALSSQPYLYRNCVLSNLVNRPEFHQGIPKQWVVPNITPINPRKIHTLNYAI